MSNLNSINNNKLIFDDLFDRQQSGAKVFGAKRHFYFRSLNSTIGDLFKAVYSQVPS